MINTDIKLPKPEKYYGAMYGRAHNSQKQWYASFYISTAISFFVYTVALITLPETATTTILITMIIALVGLSLLASHIFGTKLNKFKQDLYDNRIKYAQSTFKKWVEQKYDIQITPEAALQLMNGKNTTVENQTLCFKETPNTNKLFTIGTPDSITTKNIKNWDYDTDKIDFQLVSQTLIKTI